MKLPNIPEDLKKIFIIGSIALICFIVFIYSAGKTTDNIYKSRSDNILNIRCEEWPIVTDGKIFRFKYPNSKSPAMSDYNTKQDAIDGACRQYAYEKRQRDLKWRPAD